MVCPGCDRHYGFGDNCPACGCRLVGASVVDAERVAVEPLRIEDRHPAVLLLLVCTFTVVSVLACAGLFGGWMR